MTYRRTIAALLACASVSVVACNPERTTGPDPLLSSLSSGAPSSLAAGAPTPTHIDLSWQDNSNNETGFEVERGRTSTGPFSNLTTLPAGSTWHADLTVVAGTTYCYRVRAVRDKGRTTYSAYSNVACATTPSPPAAPQGVKAELVDVGRVRVSWQPSTGATTYHVERAATADGSFTRLATPSSSPYEDPNRQAEVQVCYRVVAANAHGETASGASCTMPPAAPSNLTTSTPGGGGVTLGWSDNSNAESGYEIQRARLDYVFATIATLPAGTTSHHDATVESNIRYVYRVRALRDLGYSWFSNYAEATVVDAVPVTPKTVRALAISSTVLFVDWTDDSENETGFRVERSATGADPWTAAHSVGAGSTGIHDGDRTPDEKACYRVIAFNSFGEAPPSATACAIPPAAPTNLQATPAANGSITLTWTANSSSAQGYEIRRQFCNWYYGYGYYYGGYPQWVCYMYAVASVSGTVTTWTDSGLNPGETYTYEVVATRNEPGDDRRGYSTPSPIASATPGS